MPPTHDDDPVEHLDTQEPAAPTSGAGRPRLALTDDEARSLKAQVDPIIAAHAENPHQHRPFVHDFIRAVYYATGKTFSSGSYRKLLGAYAPGRTPSTATLEAEKKLLEQDLKRHAEPREIAHQDTAVQVPEPVQGARGGAAPPADLAQLEILGVLRHVAARLDRLEQPSPDVDRADGYQVHNDFLRERLEQAETALATAQARAAHLGAALAAAKALADEREREIELMRAAADKQAASLAAMVTEIEGTRLFALRAMDDVRGETRAVRERCDYLLSQLKERDEQVEQLRRLVMNRGAAPR